MFNLVRLGKYVVDCNLMFNLVRLGKYVVDLQKFDCNLMIENIYTVYKITPHTSFNAKELNLNEKKKKKIGSEIFCSHKTFTV